MSLWTCDLCKEVLTTQRMRAHKLWKCPDQGMGKQQRENPLKDMPCKCGCGVAIPQKHGQRPKHYATTDCYERVRTKQRAKGRLQPRPTDTQTTPPKPCAVEQETAFLRRLSERAEAEAGIVPILTGEASYALWGRCLGVAL